MDYKLHAEYDPTGDQPQAIAELAGGVNDGVPYQTLLGVTGSGKTFTMANVIAQTGRPTLVLSHNKTLAAQLYAEFKSFFPENAVHYFVSYYDYYQPEAYIPSTDKYIEKDLAINDEIERLRLSTVTALLSGRRDIVVVSSVSCLYGMGNPEDITANAIQLRVGDQIGRDELLHRLVDALYSRSDTELRMGTFRVKGDTVDVFLSDEDIMLRIIFWGNEIERIQILDSETQLPTEDVEGFKIFPANIFVTTKERMRNAMGQIDLDRENQVAAFARENRFAEAKRLNERVIYDMEMMREVGYCSGIENYSRVISNRAPGSPPMTLLDYFPKDFLLFVDESHVTLPQVRAMYRGDRARKDALVNYGFRLPSAYDNRPLTFDEFLTRIHQRVYVSATPGPWERERAGQLAEQIIRPTGLLDPEIVVRPVEGQIDDLIGEINDRIARNQRVLVTTLTKKMAEDLSEYLSAAGIRTRYMHHDIGTIERMEIIRDLRAGAFDVLVGINLLREGLDIPEISLVAILDADKEGFLRSETALIQTIGRAARNAEGHVVLYADTVTDSMAGAIGETNRRRRIQQAYNDAHGITPQSVKKAVRDLIAISHKLDEKKSLKKTLDKDPESMDDKELKALIAEVTKRMHTAAAELNFEEAALQRDRMIELKKILVDRGE